MKSKTTLGLLLLVLAIVGVYFTAKERIPSSDEQNEKNKRVIRFKVDDVREIRILGIDQEFHFSKQGDFWNLTHPIQVRASRHEIEGILIVLEDLESRRTLSPASIAEAKLTLADYGLLKPKTVLQLGLGEKSIKVHLGNLSRQGDGLYIQIAGDPAVYLVDKEVSRRLDKKLDDYRERSLFDFTASQVNRFQIKNASSIVEFSKTDGQWRLTQPLSARVDQEIVQKLLEQTVATQADSFLSEEAALLSEWGLDETAREITFWNHNEEELQGLLLGSKLKDDETKIAAKLKGKNSVLAVSANHALDTGHALSDYRDRSLASFLPKEIQEIELKTRADSILVRRSNTGWSMARPSGLEADADLVEKMLQKLSVISIKEFTTDVLTDLEKYGLKTPAATWTFRKSISAPEDIATDSSDERIVLQIAIGREDAPSKMLYVKRLDESSIYGLELSEVADLPKNLLHLRSRLLFQISKADLAVCKLKKGKNQLSLERGSDGNWKLSEGTLGVLNENAFRRFSNLLEHFKVEAIVGTALNGMVKTYGLDQAAATIQIGLQADPKGAGLELVIGKENASKKLYLVWKNQVLLCEISSEMQGILTQDWVTKVPAK
jgi:hypothetical protein